MRLCQTNISEAVPDRASGEKGIIEALSPKPRRLIYASDLAGQKIKGAWSDEKLDTRKNPLIFGSAGAPDALIAGSVSDRSDPGWLRAVSRDSGQTHPLAARRSWKIRRSML